MKMRVADFIWKWLADKGVRHAFLVTGGGAMHLDDGLRCEKRIKPVCNHHEQASAIAAEGYVRAGADLGVACVTTGPGGTNALTGVIGQWLDSVPVLYLSGQVKWETTICSCPELGLRQLGDQEINIVDMVRPVTKYCAMVTDPLSIRQELEKAVFLATHGRPGPVWLDIPLNVQGAVVEVDEMEPYAAPDEELPKPTDAEISQLISLLKKAKRPAIIAGHGIRIAGAAERFLELVDRLGIPVLTTFNGMDLIPDDHPLYGGRIGTIGQRAGNFILQNADLVLSIASRNNIRQVSYQWDVYARNAVKIAVDIDEAELKKKTFVPDLSIHADAGAFIEAMLQAVPTGSLPSYHAWLEWCHDRKVANPLITKEIREWKDQINPYFFMRVLTEKTPAETTIVGGNGSACVVSFQTIVVKKGQRIFWNSGCASMGYDLPAAIGAAFHGGDVVCLAGDGSVMMNLQELQTIAFYQLPVKIFLLNNNGYGSIKQTQRNFFSKTELIGCDAQSGVSFPDFVKVGETFGFKTARLTTQEGLGEGIEAVLQMQGPVLCEVMMPDFLIFTPKLSSKKLPDGRMVSAPLEDMFPFLPREEFERNMIRES